MPIVVDGREPLRDGIRPAWGLPGYFGTDFAGKSAGGGDAAPPAGAEHAWSTSKLRDPDLADHEVQPAVIEQAGESGLGATPAAGAADEEHFPHLDAADRAESMAVGAEEADYGNRTNARRWLSRQKWLYAGVGLFMLLAVGYGIDLVTSLGKVPRGTEVAGVAVGSMKPADAEMKLMDELGPKLKDPVALRAGAVSTELDPEKVGLSVDWTATLERAGEQPLNPFVRLLSFIKPREVGIVSRIPDQRLTGYLETLSREANFGPREGAIWFDQAEVKKILPLDGQKLKVEPSREAILAHWLDENGVDLPVDYTPTETNAEQVEELVKTVAEPAVAEPVTLMGSNQTPDGEEPPVKEIELPVGKPQPAAEGQSATKQETTKVEMVDPQGPDAVPVQFPRERIGEYLTFERNGANLEPQYNAEAAKGILDPLLEATQAEGRDAGFTFSGRTVTVEPAVKGRTVQWGPLLSGLQAGLLDKGPRTVPVTYETVDPKMTTEEAEKAGIREIVGEYTVDVPASGSAQSLISSLNGHFVAGGESVNLADIATTVSGDRGADAVATALFNAAYEAGMTDLVRTARASNDEAFPTARDASAASAVGFRNQQSTGIAIQAIGSGSSVTVRLWGTKQYEVRTEESDRTDVRRADTRRSTEENCTPVAPRDGYTTVVTRIVTQGGREISRDSYRSTYAPVEGVTCVEAPEDEDPPPPGIDVPEIPGLNIPLPNIPIPGFPPPGN